MIVAIRLMARIEMEENYEKTCLNDQVIHWFVVIFYPKTIPIPM